MTMFAMPMTCHPSLEFIAAGVRDYMRAGRYSISFATQRRPSAFTAEETEPTSEVMTNVTTLKVGKACGPASFIGDPRHGRADYVWLYASDSAGRWVAGESRLFWREYDSPHECTTHPVHE